MTRCYLIKNTVYVLKTALKELWYAPNEQESIQRGNEWYRQCQESGIKALKQFAEKLKGNVGGIIASARHRLNTSVLEGMNNKIKVIKRMAYGYRENDYFFLKIKAAFPGKARSTKKKPTFRLAQSMKIALTSRRARDHFRGNRLPHSGRTGTGCGWSDGCHDGPRFHAGALR